jgi:NADPH:quinone reductase-like Zn-dependent oxidoreductase
VAVEHSIVNCKDGLAITSKAPINRSPLVPGIDLAGRVLCSEIAFCLGPGEEAMTR